MGLALRFMVLLTLGAAAAAAELDAYLEHARITQEDTVNLSLVASGDVEGPPELAPLERDFAIVDRSHTSRMRFRDGRSMRSQEWRIELAPRRTGQLTVPSLQLGGLASAPLALEVIDAASAAAADKGPVFIEVSATPRKPYVKGQVAYRVRLFARAPMRDWQLTPPQTDGGVVHQIGADRELDETIDGQAYQVIERRYAIFPHRSGLIEILPPQLTATIPGTPAQADEDGFDEDPFAPLDPSVDGGEAAGTTRQLRVRGEAVTLDVHSPPSDAADPWLPAVSVALTDDWPSSGRVGRVGEPIRRALTLTAVASLGAQLPELELATPPGTELDVSPPRTRDLLDGEHPVAIKEVTASYVPTEAGLVRLPEIRLSWWDTQSDQPRTARLPPRTLRVGLGGAASDGLDPAALTDEAAGGTTRTWGRGRQLADGLRSGFHQAGIWPALAAALALGWALTTLLWWRERRRSATHRPFGATPGRQAQQRATAKARRAIKLACSDGSARETRDALLAWGTQAWPADPPRGLLALAARLDSLEARALLAGLDRALYAERPVAWDGKAAWTVLHPALDDAGRYQSSQK